MSTRSEEALLAYVDAVADEFDPNPNRPTPQGYCASCTEAPCKYAHLEYPCPDFCWPGPVTEFHEWIRTVNALKREHPEVDFFPGMDVNDIGEMVARHYCRKPHESAR